MIYIHYLNMYIVIISVQGVIVQWWFAWGYCPGGYCSVV